MYNLHFFVNFSSNMNTSMAVEEAVRTLYFSVIRTQGSTDVISVDITTRGVTAHAQMGDSLYLATIQEVGFWALIQYKDVILPG